MTQGTPLPSRGHYPSLDGFRGIAVLLVVLVHCRQLFVGNNPFDAGLAKCLSLGAHGVDLFFVLSGFLITGILLDSKQDAGYFSKFYARRALRIFPLYYLYLVVRLLVLPALAVKVSFLRGNFSNAQPHAVWVWLYATNIVRVEWMGGVFHLWSLAVEEQFYLVWPLIVYLLSRRQFWKVCVAVVLIAPVLRVLAAYYGHPEMATGLTLCRMDSLALGGLVALMQRDSRAWAWARRVYKPVLWGSAIAVVGYYTIRRQWPDYGTFNVTVCMEAFALIGAVCIVHLLTSQTSLFSRLCSSRVLISFGKFSYSIYLWHYLVVRALDKALSTRLQAPLIHGSQIVGKLIYIASCILISYGIGALSWHLFERHFLKLKRFFEYDGGSTRTAETSKFGSPAMQVVGAAASE